MSCVLCSRLFLSIFFFSFFFFSSLTSRYNHFWSVLSLKFVCFFVFFLFLQQNQSFCSFFFQQSVFFCKVHPMCPFCGLFLLVAGIGIFPCFLGCTMSERKLPDLPCSWILQQRKKVFIFVLQEWRGTLQNTTQVPSANTKFQSSSKSTLVGRR